MRASTKKNVLLLGGAGFVGDYLVKNLVATQKAVISVVHRGPLDEAVRDPSVSYHQLDLTQKSDLLKKLIDDSDCVVILTRPDETTIDNVIENARLAKRLGKIVYASTLLVYPDSENPQDENTTPDPQTPYENGKIIEENKLSMFACRSGRKLVIARLANVYGDIKNRGVIFYIIQSLLTGTVFELNGGGEQKRDFIFVEDVANLLAFLVLTEQKEQTEIFNLCTGLGYTVNELTAVLEHISEKKVKRVIRPGIAEKWVIIGDNRKIIRESGRVIGLNLTDGLRLCYSRYVSLLRKGE